MIYRNLIVSQGTDNIPLGIGIKVNGLSSELVHNPAHIILILLTVESTGTVYKVSAGLESGPDILNYLTLACGAHLNVFRTPVTDSTLVLAEHSLARAGCINGNKVKHKA